MAIITQRRIAAIPLSIYIHFPWCISKCPYCDFNSYPKPEEKIVTAYAEKLLDDLAIEIKSHAGAKLSSIYFGGGTPSLLNPLWIKKILNQIQENFICSTAIEVTLEANPGTIDLSLCQRLKEAGINRLSLGVQSFNSEKLRQIKRSYNLSEIEIAIAAIKSAGFTNFNLDLMFALPGQSVLAAVKDLEIAASFAPPHLSWYQLTLESSFKAAREKWRLPVAEELWEIQQSGESILSKLGFKQYEIAAYSKFPDSRCQHNLNYWQYGDYLGIGAGAHSKVTWSNYRVVRTWRVSNPQIYICKDKSLVAGREEIVGEKIALEFMLNALRLYQPVSSELFVARTGLTFATIARQLEAAAKLELINWQNDKIVTTPKGKNFLNNLLEIFI